MTGVLTLKQWSEGQDPQGGDLLSWSNLVLERSRQVQDIANDKVSQYFLAKWLECPKDATMVAPIFERTFQNYGLSFSVGVLNRMVDEGVLQAVDLLDFTKSNGLLQRHLLSLPEVWDQMNAVQRRDHFDYEFGRALDEGRYTPGNTHPLWSVLDKVKSSAERWKFFNIDAAPNIRREFGFLCDEKPRHTIEIFHDTIGRFANAWNVHPAQIMYGLLRNDMYSSRDYERYMGYLEPYISDIVELIQFRNDPTDIRVRNNLPTSVRPATIDVLTSFSVGATLEDMFMDKNIKLAVEHDPEADKALETLFDGP